MSERRVMAIVELMNGRRYEIDDHDIVVGQSIVTAVALRIQRGKPINARRKAFATETTWARVFFNWDHVASVTADQH